MKKVNVLDEESSLLPDYLVLIQRLKEVAEIDSDAGLSKWLGKPSTFIATCRNREGIKIETVLSKLNDAQILFVLRGRRDDVSTTPIPALAIPAAQALLGLPLEAFAPQLEATAQQVKGWEAGKVVPSTRQLALLFNLVAIAGLASHHGGHGAAVSQSASLPRQAQGAA